MKRRIIKRYVSSQEFNTLVTKSLDDVNATFGGMPLHKDHPKNVEYRGVVARLSVAKQARVDALRQHGAGSPEWKQADSALKAAQQFTKAEFNRIYGS